MPTQNQSFAYAELVLLFKERAKQAGLELPENIYMIDISLNNVFDGPNFRAEEAFWKDPQNAKLGRFVNWPLGLAGIVPPSKFSPSKRREMANSSVWKLDKIPERVAVIREMLQNSTGPDGRPIAIYVHCTAGCDRTGEVVGSYRLRYDLGLNVTQMYALDVKECGRPPNYWSTTALEWFCIYMENNGRPSLDDNTCMDFAHCKFAGKCTPTVQR
eukprot:g4354.t1